MNELKTRSKKEWEFILLMCALLLCLSAFIPGRNGIAEAQTSSFVQIQNRAIIVDNEPFFVKGVGYNPISRTRKPPAESSFAIISR